MREPSPPREPGRHGYDGARAVRPVHLLNDGDTLFTPTTGTHPLGTANPLALDDVLTAGRGRGDYLWLHNRATSPSTRQT
ncbi:hypothetical protein ACH4ND_09160 [Streptomyces sp. NPDC017179]|uniref:hypothetical protein n=1 Tax=Streptomyces sp. NPDC017179 TaxID=3364979 RepID=UPI0037A6D0CD